MKKLYNIEFVVPLGVEIKVGQFLGEGTEKAVDVVPPYKL